MSDDDHDVYCADYSEELHICFDHLVNLENSVRYFCSHMNCHECPLYKHVDPDAVYPADACPTLQHIRELRYILQEHASSSTVPECNGDDEEIRKRYKTDWVDAQEVFYKGFDENLCCRNDMQYEVGKEYCVDGPPILCQHGLHYCANILEMFDFYPPPWSRYCEITIPGDVERAYAEGERTKACTTAIRIEKELSLSQLVRKLGECRGYRFYMGTWHSADSITVDTCWTLYHCNAPVCINDASYSTMCASGWVGIANNSNSAVVTEYDGTVAASRSTDSVAFCKGNSSVAVAMSWRGVAQVDGLWSIAIAGDKDATAIVGASFGLGISLVGNGSHIRLEHPYGIAIGTAHVTVEAEHCVVLVPAWLANDCFSLRAVKGTLVIWVGSQSENPVMAVVGDSDSVLEAGKHYFYTDLVWCLLGHRMERPALESYKE